ncbi:MAG: CBS domain-containing protein [Desulfovibrionales bacterium]|nr:CBS domain-containing protein [Desulfovibrionales bacterium]
MSKRKLVTGAELLALGISHEDLIQGIKSGYLGVPVTIDGQTRTEEKDPCLYCTAKGHILLSKKIHCGLSGLSCQDQNKILEKALFPAQALGQLKDRLGTSLSLDKENIFQVLTRALCQALGLDPKDKGTATAIKECLDQQGAIFDLKTIMEALGQQADKAVDDQFKEDPLQDLSPADIVEYFNSRGVKDPYSIARHIDEKFTDRNRLTNKELGDLLPASPGAVVSHDAMEKRGKRLRKGPPEENQNSA